MGGVIKRSSTALKALIIVIRIPGTAVEAA